MCSLPYAHLLANRLNRLQMKCALADGNAYGSRQDVCYKAYDSAASSCQAYAAMRTDLSIGQSTYHFPFRFPLGLFR